MLALQTKNVNMYNILKKGYMYFCLSCCKHIYFILWRIQTVRNTFVWSYLDISVNMTKLFFVLIHDNINILSSFPHADSMSLQAKQYTRSNVGILSCLMLRHVFPNLYISVENQTRYLGKKIVYTMKVNEP